MEVERGCGFRKIGGFYLEGGGLAVDCGRLPVPLLPCHECHQEPKFTRGVQRISLGGVLAGAGACRYEADPKYRHIETTCPFSYLRGTDMQVGLAWVGDKFYTPESFIKEATQIGVSKRIAQRPKWLKMGETWIYLAHQKGYKRPCSTAISVLHAQDCDECEGTGTVGSPGVFFAFVPTRVVKIVPEQYLDTITDEQRAEEEKKLGATYVGVPDDERHR